MVGPSAAFGDKGKVVDEEATERLKRAASESKGKGRSGSLEENESGSSGLKDKKAEELLGG